MKPRDPFCAECDTQACFKHTVPDESPAFCPSISFAGAVQEAREDFIRYPELRGLAMAAARTEAAGYLNLNILMGLCVGHDSIFFKRSQAPTTVLVVKDRVTGHNPVSALYGRHFYYRRLLNP